MIRIPLYRRGAVVRYNGKDATISHVLIRKSLLYVCLKDMERPVPAQEIEIEPTVLQLTRDV
ncbi:hypothetical protein [Variovorax sp. HJSM1_2]|uniref:hypothetical protein n=1 Tax=Variovorax sp. HJSM1_2 TaxID=3366263 RepID=UPI003BEB482E